ncbi:MAG TPA: 50S ribosomal protein L2, partial [Patescibacteria group bacterium]|nr:50S ribosomal protein L2 [Patescibacteria group bacterium]
IGGGAHKKVRIVDNSRLDRKGIPAKVQTVEYDPAHTAFISLLAYKDGVKRYILTPQGVTVGTTLMYDDNADILPGNRLKFKNIPVGSFVHDVELYAGQGGRLARSAGSYCILQNLEGGFALLKLPSGELRKISDEACATIGQVSNLDWMNVRIGKAGRVRHMGIRPTVRGKVMNPVDHPHGGGEGHNPIGMKYPKTPWGKHAIGVRTRDKKKFSSKFIVQRRKK